MWEVEHTDEFEAWWEELDEEDQERIDAAVEKLQERGPALTRPIVGEIVGSRHKNMKELIPPGAGTLRILFIFDPRRTAILLVGGNKEGDWKGWYHRMIPAADDLYDEYLDELRKEGLL